MGRATVTANLGDGRYEVDVEYNMAEIDRERERLNGEIDKLVDERSDLEDKLTDAQTKNQDEKEKMNGLIDRLTNKVRQSLLDTLNSIVSRCATIEDDESSASLVAAAGGSEVASSAGALPPSPPGSITTAYAAVNTALVNVQGQLSDAVSRTHDQANYASDATSALEEDPPNFADADDIITTAVSDSYDHTGSYVDAGKRVDDLLTDCSTLNGLLVGPTYAAAKALLATAVTDFHNAKSDIGGLASKAGQLTGLWNKLAAVITPQDALEIQKGITTEQRAYLTATLELRSIQRQIDDLDAKREQMLNRLDFLIDFFPSVSWTVWPADLGLLGVGDTVGVMEIPGEFSSDDVVGELVLRPVYDPATKVWKPERDGLYSYTKALAPPCFFYNLAMLPGVQAFKPQYRFARVTAVNVNGTLSVALIDPNFSSQQAIDITPLTFVDEDFIGPPAPPAAVYQSVPVSYMDCDAEAFRVDDEVVLEYQNRDAGLPVVIGFRKNPQSCGSPFLVLSGRIQGGPGVWHFKAQSSTWGQLTWIGSKMTLSWDGSRGRRFTDGSVDYFTRFIYVNGVAVSGLDEPLVVTGLAYQDGHIMIMCWDYDSREYLYSLPWPNPTNEVPQIVTELTLPGDAQPLRVSVPGYHWAFDPTGTTARTIRVDEHYPQTVVPAASVDHSSYVVEASVSMSGASLSIVESATISTDGEGGVVDPMTGMGSFDNAMSGDVIWGVDYLPGTDWVTDKLTVSFVWHEDTDPLNTDPSVRDTITITASATLARNGGSLSAYTDSYSFSGDGAGGFYACDITRDFVSFFFDDIRFGRGGYISEHFEASGVNEDPDGEFTSAYSANYYVDGLGTINSVSGAGSIRDPSSQSVFWTPWSFTLPLTGTWNFDKSGDLCFGMLFELSDGDTAGKTHLNHIDGGDLGTILGLVEDNVVFPIGVGR